MKPGESILILPSFALNEIGISQLAGATAVITEVVGNHDNIHGCWVRLPFKFMDENEWFIPYSSLVS